MMGRKDFVLINTHIPRPDEIPGTDRLSPYDEIERYKNKLREDKASRIVVYCKAGPMGDAAAGKRVHMGYTHVIHFKDGMNGWERAENPCLSCAMILGRRQARLLRRLITGMFDGMQKCDFQSRFE
jgi:hypothetical protein